MLGSPQNTESEVVVEAFFGLCSRTVLLLFCRACFLNRLFDDTLATSWYLAVWTGSWWQRVWVPVIPGSTGSVTDAKQGCYRVINKYGLQISWESLPVEAGDNGRFFSWWQNLLLFQMLYIIALLTWACASLKWSLLSFCRAPASCANDVEDRLRLKSIHWAQHSEERLLRLYPAPCACEVVCFWGTNCSGVVSAPNHVSHRRIYHDQLEVVCASKHSSQTGKQPANQ